MNLEDVEQKSIAYLEQVARPLVPIDQLLRYLQRDGAMLDVTRDELLAFLSRHDLFRVVDPLAITGGLAQAGALEEAGFNMGPSVILASRVPSPGDILHHLHENMQRMVQALHTALNEASTQGDMTSYRQMKELVQRAEDLQKRVDELQ